MTEKDRLILNQKLSAFPELEWTRGNRTWWIGRLKKKSFDTSSVNNDLKSGEKNKELENSLDNNNNLK